MGHILRNEITKSKFSSVTRLCLTLCDPMNRSTPGLSVHHQLPEFTQTQSIESVMPSSHLILCRPLLLLPPTPHSIRVFSNDLILHVRWPKYWNFSFSIIPSKETPGLISAPYLIHRRRQWQPTPVLLPGKSHGRRSLVGCRLWGRTELEMTEVI